MILQEALLNTKTKIIQNIIQKKTFTGFMNMKHVKNACKWEAIGLSLKNF